MAITFTRLNTTGLFLWGVLKDQVYDFKPKTELKNAFSDKFRQITIEMCQKVSKSVTGRVQNFMENEGEYFEYLKLYFFFSFFFKFGLISLLLNIIKPSRH